MKPSKMDLIKKTIQPNRIFQIREIMEKCELSKISAIQYLKKNGVLTSFNKKGQYYILAQCRKIILNSLNNKYLSVLYCIILLVI